MLCLGVVFSGGCSIACGAFNDTWHDLMEYMKLCNHTLVSCKSVVPTLPGPIPLWGSKPPQLQVGALKSYHIRCIGRAGPVAIGLFGSLIYASSIKEIQLC